MDSFKKMVPEHASVIRNGEEKRILADDLVLGDVVEIRAGDRVPADIRLFEAKGLKVFRTSSEHGPKPSSVLLMQGSHKIKHSVFSRWTIHR